MFTDIPKMQNRKGGRGWQIPGTSKSFIHRGRFKCEFSKDQVVFRWTKNRKCP